MAHIPPTRRQELTTLFERALAVPSKERESFIARQTGDPALRTEIARLLAVHERADGFPEPLDPSDPGLFGSETPVEAIGRYRILRCIGRGETGIVYLARDPRQDRPVAVEVFAVHKWVDRQARQRFVAESQQASALDHPHIATIYEVGEIADGPPYLAMPYYEGGTLSRRVRDGALRVRDALALGLQIADALAAAHEGGLVHCDLKPANVVLTSTGLAKVVGFGVARLHSGNARQAPGTPAYMSPEQLRGEIDPRCDVWAFGVTMYEMLAGFRPFEGMDAEAVRRAIHAGDMPSLEERRPDVPPSLLALVHRCLELDPARRPANGRALFEELRQIETSLRQARPEAANPAPWRAAKAAGALVSLGVVAWLSCYR